MKYLQLMINLLKYYYHLNTNIILNLFLKVFDTKNLANQNLEKLSYLNYDFKTQKFSKSRFWRNWKNLHTENLVTKKFFKIYA